MRPKDKGAAKLIAGCSLAGVCEAASIKLKSMSNEATTISSAFGYRIEFGRLGIVFDGPGMTDALVRFTSLVARSKAAASRLAAGSVLSFKDAKITGEYHP